MKNKFYWVSQNRTFKVERRDGYLWAPYFNKNKREIFHWNSMKDLRKGDVIFSATAITNGEIVNGVKD